MLDEKIQLRKIRELASLASLDSVCTQVLRLEP